MKHTGKACTGPGGLNCHCCRRRFSRSGFKRFTIRLERRRDRQSLKTEGCSE